jgi:hypothetical protein
MSRLHPFAIVRGWEGEEALSGLETCFGVLGEKGRMNWDEMVFLDACEEVGPEGERELLMFKEGKEQSWQKGYHEIE